MKKAMAVLVLGALAGCAGLGLGVVQPPSFDRVPGREAEFRLTGPSRDARLGGARLRLWAQAYNPNPFGITLSTLNGDLFLEGVRAADVNLPLGLPLTAQRESEFPIDVTVGFSDLPGLAGVAGRALNGEPLQYRIEGTVGVDAGPLGQPTFGPLRLIEGEVRPERLLQW